MYGYLHGQKEKNIVNNIGKSLSFWVTQLILTGLSKQNKKQGDYYLLEVTDKGKKGRF